MPAFYREVLKARCILKLSLGEFPHQGFPEGFHIIAIYGGGFPPIIDLCQRAKYFMVAKAGPIYELLDYHHPGLIPINRFSENPFPYSHIL